MRGFLPAYRGFCISFYIFDRLPDLFLLAVSFNRTLVRFLTNRLIGLFVHIPCAIGSFKYLGALLSEHFALLHIRQGFALWVEISHNRLIGSAVHKAKFYHRADFWKSKIPTL